MRYEDIPGWWSDHSFYAERVAEAGGAAHFVEVGSWQGRSAASMAEAIHDSYTPIRFDCVDTWEGTSGTSHDNLLDGKPRGWLRAEFETNLRKLGLWQYVNPITGDSVEVASTYLPESLDFVFVDGDHSREAVGADVASWWPKVKPGGMIAGHDWTNEQVQLGVLDALQGRKVESRGMIWWVRKSPAPERHYVVGVPEHNDHEAYCLSYLYEGLDRLGVRVERRRDLEEASHKAGPGKMLGTGKPFHIASLEVNGRRVWFDFSDFTGHFAADLGKPYLKVQSVPGVTAAGQFLTEWRKFFGALGGLLHTKQDMSLVARFSNIDELHQLPRRRSFVSSLRNYPKSDVGLWRYSNYRDTVPEAIRCEQMQIEDFWHLCARARVNVAMPGVGGDFTRHHVEVMAQRRCLLTVETEQTWPGNWRGCWAEMRRDLSDAVSVVEDLVADPQECSRLAHLGWWYFHAELTPEAMAGRVLSQAP